MTTFLYTTDGPSILKLYTSTYLMALTRAAVGPSPWQCLWASDGPRSCSWSYRQSSLESARTLFHRSWLASWYMYACGAWVSSTVKGALNWSLSTCQTESEMVGGRLRGQPPKLVERQKTRGGRFRGDGCLPGTLRYRKNRVEPPPRRLQLLAASPLLQVLRIARALPFMLPRFAA